MRGLLACLIVPCAASLVMAANVARATGAPPIALASDEGQKLLAECGSTLAYDALWPHWTKQVGKTCCAPCTLAMVCNALGVDKRWGRDIERWETVAPSGPHRPDGPWDEDDVLARSTDPAAAREGGTCPSWQVRQLDAGRENLTLNFWLKAERPLECVCPTRPSALVVGRPGRLASGGSRSASVCVCACVRA